MLAYLHTGLVPFSALPSDFLVLHDQARAAEGKEGTPETETFHFADWQGEAFDGLAGQRDWEGVSCCTPHSMYRLADRYEMDELREMSLGFILRSLTVENVSPPLLPILSRDSYTRCDRSLTSSSVLSRSTTKSFRNRFSSFSSRTG